MPCRQQAIGGLHVSMRFFFPSAPSFSSTVLTTAWRLGRYLDPWHGARQRGSGPGGSRAPHDSVCTKKQRRPRNNCSLFSFTYPVLFTGVCGQTSVCNRRYTETPVSSLLPAVAAHKITAAASCDGCCQETEDANKPGKQRKPNAYRTRPKQGST